MLVCTAHHQLSWRFGGSRLFWLQESSRRSIGTLSIVSRLGEKRRGDFSWGRNDNEEKWIRKSPLPPFPKGEELKG